MPDNYDDDAMNNNDDNATAKSVKNHDQIYCINLTLQNTS